MRRSLLSLAPFALFAALLAGSAERTSSDAPVDATLLTAIDLSSSIMRHDEWLQVQGMARAIKDAEFLAAIARGRHGRIRFAVFSWSSHGQHRLLVPWAVIDGATSATAVATLLREVPRPDRFRSAGRRHSRASPPPERWTDLSEAIRFGTSLFSPAPGQGERRILNVISNGADNVGAGTAAARDAALDAGITINGVVLGGDPELATYFRERVIGGARAFVMRVIDMQEFEDVVRAKFLRDLIAGPAPGRPLGA